MLSQGILGSICKQLMVQSLLVMPGRQSRPRRYSRPGVQPAKVQLIAALSSGMKLRTLLQQAWRLFALAPLHDSTGPWPCVPQSASLPPSPAKPFSLALLRAKACSRFSWILALCSSVTLRASISHMAQLAKVCRAFRLC